MSTRRDDDTADLFDSAPPPPSSPAGGAGDDGEPRLPLGEYAERQYLAYAMSVVRARALPQVEDGLKPVQRRILYAMHDARLAPGAKHVKSARVVGDVIGKYHPHGDASVYDATVRMAQDFSLRYPLVDGQGNWGSRDGDGAAAMRYTECRLTPIAELLLGEIDQGTVDFAPNYDGAFEEPKLLPARLPMVLLNGASGIAVGMATEIPSHNLGEVAQAASLLIKRPNASLDEVLALLPGPDFPGGGQLITRAPDVRELYSAGRGSLRMRARWRFEELARGQWRAIVHQLPHGISVAQVLGEIEALTNPQPRAGRKEVSPEQKNARALLLAVLDSVRDESSDREPVRIVLEPRTSKIGRDELLNTLLAHTSLETGVPVNLTMMGRDGRPQQKGLMQVLAEWIDFRYVTLERRSLHRLGEVERRIHLLEGRMSVLLRIEEVIRVIRESDEPKADLMRAFALSAVQAEDILEIRLRQLARLEGIRIEKELGELRAERDGLNTVLGSRSEMTRMILKEIAADAKRYGDARRTLIEAVEPVAPAEIAVPDEPMTVIVSRNGWVRARQGHGIDTAAIAYKAGDFPLALIETRSVWPLCIVDTNGRAYSVRVSDLPGGRGDGVPITTMIDLQPGPNGAGRVAHALSGDPAARWMFANSAGYGFITELATLVSRPKAGKSFMSLEPGEQVLRPRPVASGAESVAALSEHGRLLLFPLDEMKVQAGGRGVIVMGLEAKERLVDVLALAAAGVEILGTGRGGKATRIEVGATELAHHRLHRARKGCLLPKKLKPTGFAP